MSNLTAAEVKVKKAAEKEVKDHFYIKGADPKKIFVEGAVFGANWQREQGPSVRDLVHKALLLASEKAKLIDNRNEGASNECEPDWIISKQSILDVKKLIDFESGSAAALEREQDSELVIAYEKLLDRAKQIYLKSKRRDIIAFDNVPWVIEAKHLINKYKP